MGIGDCLGGKLGQCRLGIHDRQIHRLRSNVQNHHTAGNSGNRGRVGHSARRGLLRPVGIHRGLFPLLAAALHIGKEHQTHRLRSCQV